MITVRNCVVALMAGACIAASGGTAARHAQDAGYWTQFRMEHAVPMGTGSAPDSAADGLAWSSGGVVTKDIGKIFFTLDDTDYVCSGAAVGHGVVVTAAHCLSDGYGGWATNWTFVPGYSDGNQPYGSYPSHKFFVSRLWDGGMDEGYDIGFVAVHGLSRGLPVEFDTAPRTVYVFGYPAEPPYNGQGLTYCSGRTQTDPGAPGADTGVRCGMTAGDSGGPWLQDFDPVTGTGTVVAISAFKYSDDDEILYGAPLGRTARLLYREAEKGLFGQQVDLPGQHEVRRGQPARRVRREFQRHLVPLDTDVRMMPGTLGEKAHRVHEQQRVAEVGPRHHPHD